MATQKPLDIQYGLSLNGTVILDREQNLAVKNASIENLNVTGTLTAVNTTDSYLKDNNILLNSGIEAGAVSTLGSVTGGSGYTQGTYRNVPLVVSSGTAGYGATADIVVSTGGVVTSVTKVNAGVGYATNTVFTVAAADIDSDNNGTNFSVPVTAVTAGSAATDAFITVARGTSGTDVALKWMESNDAFFGTPRWQLTNDGSNYYSIYVTNDADTSATANKLVLRDGSGNINVNDIGVGNDLSVTGTSLLTGEVTVNTGIIPDADEGAYIGTTSRPFSEGHFGEIQIAPGSEDNDITTASGNLVLDSAGGTVNVQDNLDVDGDVNIDGGDLTVSTTTFNLANTTATTVNAFGAGTTIEIGASTGTTNVNNNLVVDLDLQVKGGDITTNQTTFNLLDTNATTINAFGAATTIDIGASTGTTNINNNLDVDGDVNIDGGDLTVSTTTFNLANTTATTLNLGGASTTLNVSHVGTGARTINIATAATGGASTLTFGGGVTGNTLKIQGTTAGQINLTTDVTTGIANLFTSVTGKLQIGGVGSELYVGTQTAVTGTTTTVATTAQTVTDQFSTTEFRSAEYLVQITQGSSYQVSKILLVHDGTTPYITEYGTLLSGSTLGTLDVDITGGNARLLVTMANATSASVKVSRTSIIV